jgi:hypothetical protein
VFWACILAAMPVRVYPLGLLEGAGYIFLGSLLQFSTYNRFVCRFLLSPYTPRPISRLVRHDFLHQGALSSFSLRAHVYLRTGWAGTRRILNRSWKWKSHLAFAALSFPVCQNISTTYYAVIHLQTSLSNVDWLCICSTRSGRWCFQWRMCCG